MYTPFFSLVARKSARRRSNSALSSRILPVFVTRAFTSGRHFMDAALRAYSSVEIVSSTADAAGDTVATTHVFDFPPNASRSSLVSFESRYGTCPSRSTSAVMTRPRVRSDLLISPASRARESLAPDLDTFSEPARSTRLSLPHRTTSSPSASVSRACTDTVKTLCERLDCLLHSVSAVRRRFEPAARCAKMSAGEETHTSVR